MTKPFEGMDPAFLPEIVLPTVKWHKVDKPTKPPVTPRPPAPTYLYQGEQRTACEIAKLVGLNPSALSARLNRGYALEDAILPKLPARVRTPMPSIIAAHSRKSRAPTHFYQGEYRTLVQIAALTGVNRATLRLRLSQDLSLEEAAAPERRKRQTTTPNL